MVLTLQPPGQSSRRQVLRLTTVSLGLDAPQPHPALPALPATVDRIERTMDELDDAIRRYRGERTENAWLHRIEAEDRVRALGAMVQVPLWEQADERIHDVTPCMTSVH